MVAATKEYLTSLLIEAHGLAPDEFDEDSPLFSSGLLDSFVLIDLITGLEKSQHIRIPPGELRMENIDSIRRLASMVERLSAKATS